MCSLLVCPPSPEISFNFYQTARGNIPEIIMSWQSRGREPQIGHVFRDLYIESKSNVRM
jgi:hypothetical protein